MSDILVSIENNVSILIDKSSEPTILSIQEPTLLQNIEENIYLNTTQEVTSLLHTGITGPQGEAGPTAGITDASDDLTYIGSGTGASKTTTEIFNNIIYEKFGIGDEIFVQWLVPDDIERNFKQWFMGNFFSVTSEVGTTSSWEIHISTQSHNAPEYTGTIYATDLPLSDTAYIPTQGEAELPAGVYITADTVVAHIRLKRVASSNDPTDGVGVVNLHMHYTSDGRVGVQGEQGLPGGEDDVAQATRTDFTTNDTIIYKGEAVPGTPDATALWRVRRLTIAEDNDVVEEWADGTADYIKVWDDRYTYTYS